MNKTLPQSLKKVYTHYCPGCGHGLIHRLLGECIDELQIREKVIAIAPVGCAVFAYFYWNFDTAEAPHGRAPAVATGIKRVLPNRMVISYQGDGDLAAIGGNEILHTANRGENITVFFVNNACFGMTGGQMAPTTVLDQITTTTQQGRTKEDGYPLRVCELLATLDGVTYLERVAVHNPVNIIKTRKAMLKALRNQMEGKGFSLVEILSMCPSGWGTSALSAIDFLEKNLLPYFPLGVYKDKL